MVRRIGHFGGEEMCFGNDSVEDEARLTRVESKEVGDMSGEGTPGSIPNPAVKLVSADGTAGATLWESRSLPTPLLFSSFHFFIPLPPLFPFLLLCPFPT